MKNIVFLLTLILMLFMTGCSEQLKDTTSQTKSSSSSTNDINSNEFPDTWYDFSSQQPLFDDSGDADNYDIKKVFVADDTNYIYVAFEVEGEKIDCTTMIHGGECIFVTIDMPNIFEVNNNTTQKVLADSDGNGDYAGIASYKYEKGLLQMRVPLCIYKGSKEFIINTLFRGNKNGIKNEADKCDELKYIIK